MPAGIFAKNLVKKLKSAFSDPNNVLIHGFDLNETFMPKKVRDAIKKANMEEATRKIGLANPFA